MSILDEINAQCQIGSLIKFEATGDPREHRIPESARRKLFISRGIQRFLQSDRHLVEETRADFSDFVMGELIQVALHVDHKDCWLARLERPEEEIWEIRIYDTTPQLRFYGRFAGQDTFVALMGPQEKSRVWRRTLNYDNIKKACAAEWNRLLKNPALSKGDDINAYLSSNVDLA
ncbi:MAG: hypothetical protein WBQ86_02205 [Candidatus Binatus sp.]